MAYIDIHEYRWKSSCGKAIDIKSFLYMGLNQHHRDCSLSVHTHTVLVQSANIRVFVQIVGRLHTGFLVHPLEELFISRASPLSWVYSVSSTSYMCHKRHGFGSDIAGTSTAHSNTTYTDSGVYPSARAGEVTDVSLKQGVYDYSWVRTWRAEANNFSDIRV